jgi:hypothetical protein
MEMKSQGKKKWVIPGINIPAASHGLEPEFLSQDRITILNTGENAVAIKLTAYRADDEPLVFASLSVEGRRLRKIRLNDLINPLPLYLESEYSLIVESEDNVIVQFFRMNTGGRNTAITGTIAFGYG